MKTQKTRIVVGAEPFVLRTAMQRVLEADPRLDPVLCPAEIDPAAVATGADIVLVSSPVEIADAVVALLGSGSERIELHRNGDRQSLPYQGLEGLAELLASIASIFPAIDLTDETRAPPESMGRSDPENGGPPRGP